MHVHVPPLYNKHIAWDMILLSVISGTNFT